MTKYAKLPDGTRLSFSESTTQAAMDAAVKAHIKKTKQKAAEKKAMAPVKSSESVISLAKKIDNLIDAVSYLTKCLSEKKESGEFEEVNLRLQHLELSFRTSIAEVTKTLKAPKKTTVTRNSDDLITTITTKVE